ncbi:MAG TPA: hypothetical protein VJT67_08370 [Longimicrobiaceae bacterium]|nr:hypothetical protein [Longimicrobiaceae bacterium]
MEREDIRSVKRRHSAELMSRAGVQGFGIERGSTGEEELVVHVSSDDPALLASLPRELSGYAVRIQHGEPFRKLGDG